MNETLSEVVNLVVVIVTFLVIFSILGLWAARHSRQRPMGRQAVRFDETQTREFRGQGDSSVTAGELLSAQYRLDFRFPDDVLVKIELVEINTGNSGLVLLKSGIGVSDFTVENAGSYRFHVEPVAQDSRWSFTIKPVGLFNRLSS